MAEPLNLRTIADRLDPAVRMARAIEFAIRGADIESHVVDALTELAMRHHDYLSDLARELHAQLEAERAAKAEREGKP